MSSEFDTEHEGAPSSKSLSQDSMVGAIGDTRNRLSLLTNQLANLRLDIMAPTDLDGQERSPNNAISRSMDVHSSPRSSEFSGDIPETMPGNKPLEKPTCRNSSRDGSMELESHWRESETGTLSDEHDHYRAMQEVHDGSSCSSRSWSVGKPIGFGVSAADQFLLRNLTRGSASRRRYDGQLTTNLQEQRRTPTKRRDDDVDAQTWVLNTILPYSCWTKKEPASDYRLTGRETSINGMTGGGNSRRNKIKRSVHVPQLSQSVRTAIGNLWDDCCLETAYHIWHLVVEFLSKENDDTIDPDCCWISGRSIAAASDDLPFAFTIHTFSSACRPCTFSHANVIAEITPIVHQTVGKSQKSRVGQDHRDYGLGGIHSFSAPEPMSPPSGPPWNRVQSSNSPSALLRKAASAKEGGSESLSTFSFNSVNLRAEKGEMSSETLSTADLTPFIRVAEARGDKQRQRGNQQTQRAFEDSPISQGGHTSSSRDHERSKIFNEENCVWEMHYPDLKELDSVIASRKHRLNEEYEARRTYMGDTDSGDDGSENEPSAVEEDFEDEDPDKVEPVHNQNQELVPYQEENNDGSGNAFQPQFLDTDPWSEVATASSKTTQLTESMEVNVGEDESGKRRGRMRPLSTLLRRVKRMIGTSSAGDSHRFISPLPTIHDGNELDDGEPEELSGYYTCETPSPTAMQRSRSLTPSPDRNQPHPPMRSVSHDIGRILSGAHHDRDARRAGSVDSESGALSERNFMLAPLTSLSSTIYEANPNGTWEESRSIKLPIKDLGNGKYLALGQLSGQGKYSLTVKIGKKPIGDGPKTINVVDPTTLGSGIGEDGPFFQRAESPVFPSTSTMLFPHPNLPPCHTVAYDQERLDCAQKHSHVGDVDMLFLVDCTSSMASELLQLPSIVDRIEQLLKETTLVKRLRMAVIGYRDHHPEDEDNFLLRRQDFTENTDRVKDFISGLEADGKNDYPDAMELALEEAVEGVRWSLFSARFILWIGDAPPHGYQGFKHKEAISEAKRFKAAKARLKKAAYEVDVAMMNEASPRQLSSHDRDLADALEACEAIGTFYDKYPMGIPGRVRWEEAIERVSSIGTRVIAMGLRNAVGHPASSNCLRTIAHVSGGVLLEASCLDASVIAALTVAIVEQSLDQQLIEEEVCDLIISLRNDFEQQTLEDRRQTLVDSMSQAAKQPHRLQLFPGNHPSQLADSRSRSATESHSQSNALSGALFRPNSPSTAAHSSSTVGPLSIPRGSFDITGSHDLSTVGDLGADGKALLLGMSTVRFDARALDQALASIRNKAERTSRCLISNFELPEQWFEFHTQQASDGLYRRERNRVSALTSPLALRYVIATRIMAAKKP